MGYLNMGQKHRESVIQSMKRNQYSDIEDDGSHVASDMNGL